MDALATIGTDAVPLLLVATKRASVSMQQGRDPPTRQYHPQLGEAGKPALRL